MKCRVSGWVELIQLLGIGSLLKPSPLCVAMKNIGEVLRSDGGVENSITSVCLYRTYLFSPYRVP